MSLADLRLVIAHGRLGPDSFVIRDDQTDWITVSACPELNSATDRPKASESPPSPRQSVAQLLDAPAQALAKHREWYTEDLPVGLLREQNERGAKMFFWISTLAAAVYLFSWFGAQHIPRRFAVSDVGKWTEWVADKTFESLSLASPRITMRLVYDYDLPPMSVRFGAQQELMPRAIGPRANSWLYNKWARFGIELGVILLFAVFGSFAKERKTWAYIAGLTLYTVDFGLCAYYKNWWATGFHLLPITFIVLGLRANIRHFRGL